MERISRGARVMWQDVKQQQLTEEGPREVTVENVCFWSRHARELEGSIKRKALLFLSYDCIHYLGYDSTFESKYTFMVLPLNTSDQFCYNNQTLFKKPFPKDYNSSEYLLYKKNDGRWICNCQGWRSAERDDKKRKADGVQCSHILALFLAFKCRKFGVEHGATQKQIDYDEFNE